MKRLEKLLNDRISEISSEEEALRKEKENKNETQYRGILGSIAGAIAGFFIGLGIAFALTIISIIYSPLKKINLAILYLITSLIGAVIGYNTKK